MWTTGQELQQGKYHLEKMLGIGGFGVTYLATEQPSGRSVAIKTLNVVTQNKPNFDRAQEQFIKEALRLSQCSHPHIVRVYDIFQEGDLWGIAMEYIAGLNLKDYLEQKSILSEAEGLRYIRQIGEALICVHSKGFLHRDVKPQNIMLRSLDADSPDPYEAVLIDFGSAREFTVGKTETHTNIGTECFAPIEQYEKRARRGEFTDVYALASTLYLLLTGKRPCPADFRDQGMKLIPPKQHNSSLRPQVNDAMLKGMELLSEDRSQTVREWLNLLVDITNIEQLDRADSPNSSQAQFQLELSSLTASVSELDYTHHYTHLENFLKAQKWKEADEETYELMLEIAKEKKNRILSSRSLQNFPCEELQKIDRLWCQYSNKRFGFSSQVKALEKLDVEHLVFENRLRFFERVGWYRNNRFVIYSDANFTLTAQQGHLPYKVWIFAESIPDLAKRLFLFKFERPHSADI